jgi:hypothetical protein
MGSTILFLAIMAVLLKYSSINKFWLSYAIFTGLLAKCGYELGMVGMIVSVVIWKIVKDIYNQL